MDDSYLLFGALVMWLICAVVAAGIAAERGRSGAGFFFVTLFILGPIGVGVALLAPHGAIERAQLAAIAAKKKAQVPPVAVAAKTGPTSAAKTTPPASAPAESPRAPETKLQHKRSED